MIRSVVREHHWPPSVIGGLFIDSEDRHGLGYWYEDVKEHVDSMKPKKK